jgi:hypothetical protein
MENSHVRKMGILVKNHDPIEDSMVKFHISCLFVFLRLITLRQRLSFVLQ